MNFFERSKDSAEKVLLCASKVATIIVGALLRTRSSAARSMASQLLWLSRFPPPPPLPPPFAASFAASARSPSAIALTHITFETDVARLVGWKCGDSVSVLPMAKRWQRWQIRVWTMVTTPVAVMEEEEEEAAAEEVAEAAEEEAVAEEAEEAAVDEVGDGDEGELEEEEAEEKEVESVGSSNS